MQGVHPKPNANPIIYGNKMLLDFLASNLLSKFNKGILINPISCNEKIIIMAPAIILKISEFFKNNCPKNDADAPNKINTVEKPKQNKIKGNSLIFFFSKISSRVCPEINDKYPGINGNTHGDKKLINPAPKAISNSNIYPVFFIAADMPAIDVNKASFKNFLSKLFFLDFIFFITMG